MWALTSCSTGCFIPAVIVKDKRVDERFRLSDFYMVIYYYHRSLVLNFE